MTEPPAPLDGARALVREMVAGAQDTGRWQGYSLAHNVVIRIVQDLCTAAGARIDDEASELRELAWEIQERVVKGLENARRTELEKARGRYGSMYETAAEVTGAVFEKYGEPVEVA